jgi:CheY-like chemotaxis protein
MLSAMTTRVLIVDDNAALGRAVRDLLHAEGLVVTGVASNPSEAIRLAEEHDPDVVLIDVDLGPDSGFDLAERVTVGTGRRWPAILMSAHDERDLEDLIAASPALGFVSKALLSAKAILDLLASRERHDAD